MAGDWRRHPRHGAQFAVERVRVREPSGEAAVLAYLHSIKHVGIRGAAWLVDRHGLDAVLDEIDRDPDRALRDRRMLSADGIFIVVATISGQDGQSVAAPELIFRGVPFMEDADASLLEEMRDVVESSLARLAEEGVTEPVLLQQDLHDDIAAFVYDRLRRRPMVLPVVVEV